MRRQSNIKSFDDLKNANRQIVIAGSGSTTANSIIPEVLAKYEKLNIKVVRGYPGISDAVLAVERGEADGVLCQRASVRADLSIGGGGAGGAAFRYRAGASDARAAGFRSKGKGAA